MTDIYVYPNMYKVISVDPAAKLLQLEEINNDNGEPKYIRIGGSVIWEESPPVCEKCAHTNSICTEKCYNFIAVSGNRKSINKHLSVSKMKRKAHQMEMDKILQMKKEGLEYDSWLFKDLFTSEDNTEKMDFDLSAIPKYRYGH